MPEVRLRVCVDDGEDRKVKVMMVWRYAVRRLVKELHDVFLSHAEGCVK